ncbi:MAG: hypothetical protein HYZ09_02255 [Candidatus Kerfeldbacteria bacterium]|nr:hypothetical protein [Candidatus Kerfeldbacteria bacterium]
MRIVVAVSALSLALLSFNGVTIAPAKAQATTDATIVGKVVKPDGTPFAFPCMPPPNPDPNFNPNQLCGFGVGAFSGPQDPSFFSGTDPNTGKFTLPVKGGKQYKLEIHGPPDKIGAYKFDVQFIEIAVGQTKDLGTITAAAKAGRINGTVVDAATNAPVPNAPVSAFPLFQGGPESGPGPGGFVQPSWGQTDANGAFSLAVDAGKYGLNVEQRPDFAYVFSGQPIDVDVATDTTVVSGIVIPVTRADATITGLVVDTNGAAIPNIPGGIGARPANAAAPSQGGPFVEFHGPIQPNGSFTLKVPSNVSTQYQLQVFLPPEADYSMAAGVTVTVVPNGTVTQNVPLAKNTSSILGKVISKAGFALNSCKAEGDQFGGRSFGEVFAHSERTGNFKHAFIKEDCSFRLSLGAGDFFFGYHLNPKAGFINRPTPPEPIVVAANQNVEKNIIVEAADAKVTGTVLSPDGTPIRAWIDADNHPEVEEKYNSGGREGKQGPRADEFVGPGGTKSPEEVIKYCSDSKNKTECENFKLPPGAEGPGGCTNMLACVQFCTANPQVCAEFDKGGHDQPGDFTVLGQPAKISVAANQSIVQAAQVNKEERSEDFFREDIIHFGVESGPDGSFELPLLSGHQYEVRAFRPPHLEQQGTFLPPKSVRVDLRSATSATVALQFRQAFGTMTGKVTLPDGSPATRCFVHFWSEDGGDGGAPCKQDGTYSMGYGQGKIYVGADSFDGNTPYRSGEEAIIVTTQKTLTKNFQLKEAGYRVPQPVSKTFAANQATTITLDDGAEITIPAGALDDSGNVTVSVSPKIDLQSTQTNQPVGVGYDMAAQDASGNQIATFNSNVTIKLPCDKDYVENELGLDTGLLDPKYVDDTTNSYQTLSNASMDTDECLATVLTDHFSSYAIVSPAGTGGLKKVVAEEGAKKNTTRVVIADGEAEFTVKGALSKMNVGTANFGGTLGQLIVVSNKTSGGTVEFYNTSGKRVKKITPFGGYTKGFQQLVADVAAKSGSTPDGVKDVIVAPTKGDPVARVYNVANKYKAQTLKTGSAGTVSSTTLSTAELLDTGVENLTTLFAKKTIKAFKLKKGKLVALSSKSKTEKTALSSLKTKSGKVEKKTETPKVKKTSPSTCSTSASTKVTMTGSGFTDSVILLWNAETALAGTTSKQGKSLSFTINPSAVDVKSVNTLTIVNADGQAGVAVISCT